MSKKETDAYAKIIKWLETQDNRLHAIRIENLISSGIPDLFLQVPDYRGVWMEVKAASGRPLIRNTQWAWIYQHRRAGGKVCVVSIDFTINLVGVWWDFSVTPYDKNFVRIAQDPMFSFYARSHNQNPDFYRSFFRMVFDPIEYRNETIG